MDQVQPTYYFWIERSLKNTDDIVSKTSRGSCMPVYFWLNVLGKDCFLDGEVLKYSQFLEKKEQRFNE